MQPLVFGIILLAAVLGVSARDIPIRIIGGSDAPDGQYPYVVSLFRGGHICAGSIINKRWILTAGHCVYDTDARRFTVIAGTNEITGNGDKYRGDRAWAHPEYHEGDYDYDIGLLRVDKDIVFHSKVQPIELPNGPFTKEDYPARVVGWGSTSIGWDGSDRLQEIELKIIAQSTCEASHPAVSEDHICTFTKSGEGTCHGDSGSPLTADGVIIGIFAFGKPCAVGYPDVYTRVWNHIDWINKKAKV